MTRAADFRTDDGADLAVLGVGSIAEAIVSGLSAGHAPPRIVLSPRNPERAKRLAALHPGVWVASDNQAAIAAADTVLICLRAADAPRVLSALSFRRTRRLISVMPSPGVDELTQLVGPVAEVSRGIPALAVAGRAGLTPSTRPPVQHSSCSRSWAAQWRWRKNASWTPPRRPVPPSRRTSPTSRPSPPGWRRRGWIRSRRNA